MDDVVPDADEHARNGDGAWTDCVVDHFVDGRCGGVDLCKPSLRADLCHSYLIVCGSLC